MKKSNRIISDSLEEIRSKMTPEEIEETEKKIDEQIKWFDDHPDYNQRYGTDKSYWLETIKKKGFNPIGITVMMCEETIILETEEEVERAWEVFKPEGFWYSKEDFTKAREDYINEVYDGIEKDAPLVYNIK